MTCAIRDSVPLKRKRKKSRMWWLSPIVPALGRLKQSDCWIHKLQTSLVSKARCQLHSRGDGREESECVDNEICHSFSFI